MPKCIINLPDFIIIGANKAGTTSLANYLNQHTEIKISDVKEPMFFSSEAHLTSNNKENPSLQVPFFSYSLSEYSDQFSSHAPGVVFYGEASTSYMANPLRSALLMRKIVPDVKIIAVLREPTSRAVSAYKMCYGNNFETRTFSKMVSESLSHKKILKDHDVTEYIRNGLYSQLIAPYLNMFDRENILFINYDELNSDPEKCLLSITSHIGASPFQYDFDKRYNTKFEHVDDSLSIPDECIEKLKEFFKDDIKITQDLTGLDLSGWL